MGTCGCGYTTDANKNCNGTHRVVQAVKADIVKDLEANGFAEASAHVKGEKAEKQSFATANEVFQFLTLVQKLLPVQESVFQRSLITMPNETVDSYTFQWVALANLKKLRMVHCSWHRMSRRG